MNKFKLTPNKYLKIPTQAFYNLAYVGHRKPKNPDYLNVLKNTFNNFSDFKLNSAVKKLETVLLMDFPHIFQLLNLQHMTVCVVPRAKAERSYHSNQLLFRSTVCSVIKQLNGFEDGTSYLRRHKNTKTTHLRKPIRGYNNDGEEPYPGITTKTCKISKNVKGKNILLVDDIYTNGVNVDEDAVQALISAGACSVAFYAVAKTPMRGSL